LKRLDIAREDPAETGFYLISLPIIQGQMGLLTPVLIGIGLSMDCFAVSLAIGSTTKSRLIRAALIIALCFGGFQAGMAALGWVAGVSVIGFISAYDHWIAFFLLLVVGGKMMGEGVRGEELEVHSDILRIIKQCIGTWLNPSRSA
jgi:putative Mn2+ efflux pump MntP